MAWEKSVPVFDADIVGFMMGCGEGKSFAARRANTVKDAGLFA
jgi:hypothetical protein